MVDRNGMEGAEWNFCSFLFFGYTWHCSTGLTFIIGHPEQEIDEQAATDWGRPILLNKKSRKALKILDSIPVRDRNRNRFRLGHF
jgi:hypothetical protein